MPSGHAAGTQCRARPRGLRCAPTTSHGDVRARTCAPNTQGEHRGIVAALNLRETLVRACCPGQERDHGAPMSGGVEDTIRWICDIPGIAQGTPLAHECARKPWARLNGMRSYEKHKCAMALGLTPHAWAVWSPCCMQGRVDDAR